MNHKPLIIVVITLLVLSFVAYLPNPVKALGGGKVQVANCVNGSATTCNSAITKVIQNDYILVAESNTLSSVTTNAPTDSCGNTYTSVVTSHVQVDVGLWITKNTCATGTNTVTCNWSGSDAIRCRMKEVSGLNSTTASVTSTGSGSSTAVTTFTTSVSTVTPATDLYCDAAAQVSDSVIVTFSAPVNSLWIIDGTLSAGTATPAQNMDRNQWPASTSTIADMTWTEASSNPKWDEVLACFKTGSDITSTITTTSTTTTTETSTSTITTTLTVTVTSTSTITSTVTNTSTTTSTSTSTSTRLITISNMDNGFEAEILFFMLVAGLFGAVLAKRRYEKNAA